MQIVKEMSDQDFINQLKEAWKGSTPAIENSLSGEKPVCCRSTTVAEFKKIAEPFLKEEITISTTDDIVLTEKQECTNEIKNTNHTKLKVR